ncbi:hypothetical protein BV22DRAFT_1037614 [Leucogyrophana mollusca]|uniref:Uncharacterized protein n=1 Tax=Leucogyrophana mollusca TaxID=85980 RepID=A0ACB8BA30_9AGAM|nr:hypothetical protein BV22DRAFT_1037614 [Leucogyrophana mollusca]
MEAELQAIIIATLRPLDNARCFELACFILLSHDYFLTFAQEVEFFWNGAWTLSRLLFFLNRYLPIIIMILTTTIFFGKDLSARICDRAIRASCTLTVFAVSINQAILLLRVWYMFPRSLSARLLALVSFVACTCASFATLFTAFKDLHSLPLPPEVAAYFPGCTTPPPSDIWRIFIPNMVIHTILFGFTVIRAMDGTWKFAHAPLMRRLLQEGGFIYFLAMVSVCFSAIGARMTAVPMINIPAAFSNFSLTINSLAVSRLMFSIRSLAGKLQTDPRWLLNPAELSRVNWRLAEGQNGGEIVVEMVTCEPDKGSGGSVVLL